MSSVTAFHRQNGYLMLFGYSRGLTRRTSGRLSVFLLILMWSDDEFSMAKWGGKPIFNLVLSNSSFNSTSKSKFQVPGQNKHIFSSLKVSKTFVEKTGHVLVSRYPRCWAPRTPLSQEGLCLTQSVHLKPGIPVLSSSNTFFAAIYHLKSNT